MKLNILSVLVSTTLCSCTFSTNIVQLERLPVEKTKKEKCTFSPPEQTEIPSINRAEFSAIQKNNQNAQLLYILDYTRRLMEHDVKQRKDLETQVEKYKNCLAKE